MSTVPFTAAISFGDHPKTWGQFALEKVDGYFGGREAIVIKGTKEAVYTNFSSSNYYLTVLKMVFIYTVFLPVTLLMFVAKVAIRNCQEYKLVDLKKKLEEGIEVSPKALEALGTAKPLEEDKFHSHLSLFRIPEAPEIDFFIPDTKDIQEAEKVVTDNLKKRLMAKEICVVDHLNGLIIPNAKVIHVEISGKKFPAIAQQRVEASLLNSINERSHFAYAKLLGEQTGQLARLMGKLGMHKFCHRNIPVIDPLLTPPKIAVVGIEHVGQPKEALFWNGLIDHVYSAEQLDKVIGEAKRLGIECGLEDKMKAHRLNEFASDKALYIRYDNERISDNHKKPITPDFDALNLPNEEATISVMDGVQSGKITKKDKKVTMKEAAKEVVDFINDTIANAPDNESVKRKRFVSFVPQEPLMSYKWIGVPDVDRLLTTEDIKKGWLYRILDALQKQGHLTFYMYGEYFKIQA